MTRPVQTKLKKGGLNINYDELLHPDLYGSLPSASRTGLPVLNPIKPEFIAPIRLVPFHEAYARKDYGCVVHFFIHDRRFLCVLRHPERYLDFFKMCRAVIEPDLSQYVDMSADDRYLGAWINRAFARYLQQHCVTVIPNVTWSLPDSYAYSFTGIPQYAPVAINCTVSSNTIFPNIFGIVATRKPFLRSIPLSSFAMALVCLMSLTAILASTSSTNA